MKLKCILGRSIHIEISRYSIEVGLTVKPGFGLVTEADGAVPNRLIRSAKIDLPDQYQEA